MAQERLAPDAILEQTGLSGSVTDIDEDPDSGDGNWLTTTGQNQTNTLSTSYPIPTGTPNEGVGLQEFRALLRKSASNNGKTDDTWTMYLFEAGVQVGSALANGSNLPTIGEVVAGTWDAADLTTPDGSDVEIKIVLTPEGSGPGSSRGCGEVGAVEWNCDYSAGTVHNGEAQSDGSSTAAADGEVDHTGVTQSDGTSTASADGEVDHTGIGQSDGTSTASAAGDVDHTGVTQSDGTSTASADGNVDHTGEAQSDGTSTATGTGTTGTTHEGAAQSDGTSTATVAGDVDHTGAGQSDGSSTAIGTAEKEATGSAQSDGTSTATGTGVTGEIHEGAGQSSGTSTATADGVEVNRYRYTSITDFEAVEKAKQGIDASAMTNKDLRYGVFDEDPEILDLYFGGNQLDGSDQAILDGIVASLPALDPIETCRYFRSANGSEWNLSITDAGDPNVVPL